MAWKGQLLFPLYKSLVIFKGSQVEFQGCLELTNISKSCDGDSNVPSAFNPYISMGSDVDNIAFGRKFLLVG